MNGEEKEEGYADIIDLPHHVSYTHARMTMAERAAQFSPFAALTGYGDAIEETARLTEVRAQRSESELEELDEKLVLLSRRIESEPCVKITYFKADEKKSGGAYLTAEGKLKKIDAYRRELAFTDGRRIPVEDIFAIESE